MPLYEVGAVVTVIRDGKRKKIKPTDGPFEFTEDEIAALDAANVQVAPYKPPPGLTLVSEKAAEAPAKPETAAERKARLKAEKEAGGAGSDIDDESL